MNGTSTPIRRTLTVVVASAAILLGFAAIRAASAWTVDAAPLVASPASAQSIEAKLADERQRSADLEARLSAITSQTDAMAAALKVAQDQIAADATQAEGLTADLSAATDKLKRLEASIKKAAAAQPASTTAVRTAPATGATATRAHREEDDGHEADDD